MYLSSWDMFAVIIALSVSLALIVTTSVANARITRSRNEWRKAYYELQHFYEHCGCAECE